MNFKLILQIASLMLLIHHQLKAQHKIIIEYELPITYTKDSVELEFVPADYISNRPEWKAMKQKREGTIVKWVLYAMNPLEVNSSLFLRRSYRYIFEPGDSIRIRIHGNSPIYLGKGGAKLMLSEQVEMAKKDINRPKNKRFYTVESFQDFLEWNDYLDKLVDSVLPILDRFKTEISPFAYNSIKGSTIADIEYYRLFKFGALCQNNERLGIPRNKLCDIFDTIANSHSIKWLLSASNRVDKVYFFYDFIRKSLHRQYGFDTQSDSLRLSPHRKVSYYNLAKMILKGDNRENYFAYLLTEEGLKEHGFIPEVEMLLAGYYAQTEYTEYREYVRKYEERYRRASVNKGRVAPDFTLIDINGKSVSKDQLKGKLVLMNFWYTGCNECSAMISVLSDIRSFFDGDTSLIILNISVDKSKYIWSRNVMDKKYVNGRIDTYTGGLGVEHPIIKRYNVSSYPKIYMFNNYGRIVSDYSSISGDNLIDLIQQQLASLQDGPYILYKNGSLISYTINRSSLSVKEFKEGDSLSFKVRTDQLNQVFNVDIKKSLEIEPSEYKRPYKIFILSDIEGDFNALRKLLQANGVIDNQYNWTFGKGHLVLNGDMFDRGEQVTECLWLIYSLEEKAKAAGGHIHFIIGNHEIMNLSGDLRYVQQKYKDNLSLINIRYSELYDEMSELGRWLRTKNVLERVGDLLFVHGGISREMNGLNLSIEQINRVARLHYSDTAVRENKDINISTIYNPSTSPFWYRDYYDKDQKERTSCSVVDSTLKKFGVAKIITGHTIVSDTISAHYDGKVLNTDTHPIGGKPEALLIEGNNYYRVSMEGNRKLLPMNLFDSQRIYSLNN